MTERKFLSYEGLRRMLGHLLPGARKIWHGTLAEWENLSAAEKAKYDQAEVIDEYTGVPVVVDKVESGNLNPVTSNAVAAAITKAVRKGTVSFENVSSNQWVTASVTFNSPMPDTDYEIIVNAIDGYTISGLQTPITIANKTVNGFSVKLYVTTLNSFSVSYTAFKL